MHCRLTFLGSMTRIDPRRSLPGARVGCWRRDDKPREADKLRCGASEGWPELYCGAFDAAIALGGKRCHAEIDFRRA
jgi:hypothetical protein